jgi:hypothetical protein
LFEQFAGQNWNIILSLTSRIVHYVMQKKKIRVVCQSSRETPANSSLRELLPQSLYFVFWPEFALHASHVYKVNNLTQWYLFKPPKFCHFQQFDQN